ncbi:hypothetical protein [Methanoplanus endosymbiosus]|uniref:Uncharacterized protein n=1 Tax=Methanoplanus endosymbiosus TaxID=33865 RepID=A0A9E7PN00_9EURY|nr:hypothetical protein [Methanoplanus endosymbiosus]UUX92845.1 hypothetical protein L6E24_01580 [Methanoplanus endosymbiosus]
MNEKYRTLKACIYNTDSVRILEILEMINFTGECRIKTDSLTIVLTVTEGVCRDAWTESEYDAIPSDFSGLKESLLIKKITEINPVGREIRLYTQNNSENKMLISVKGAENIKNKSDNNAAVEACKISEFPAEKITDDPDSLFEEELSKLDSASIIKMKEKLKREMENLAGEILNEKKD